MRPSVVTVCENVIRSLLEEISGYDHPDDQVKRAKAVDTLTNALATLDYNERQRIKEGG